MAENKSSISKKKSYKEIGEFWDTQDLSESWDKTEEANFQVDLQSNVYYYAVDNSLSSKLHLLAKKRGVSAETLLNLWLQEKVSQEVTKN